jgi:putative GTP pyrophosphokinase
MKRIDNIRQSLNNQISEKLNIFGILHNIISRTKSSASILKKLSQKTTEKSTYQMQDLIGIRITLYFQEDSIIAQKLLDSMFKNITENNSIDPLTDNTFSASRCNKVFVIPDIESDIISHEILQIEFNENTELSPYQRNIQSTFEVQFRTVLSEGWHEVEHDFRYKHKNSWENFKIETRRMNGIVAMLENCDWTMTEILDSIAYKFYKEKKLEEMIIFKYRIRLSDICIDENLKSKIDDNMFKTIFRYKKEMVFEEIIRRNYALSKITITNITTLTVVILILNDINIEDCDQFKIIKNSLLIRS